MTIVSGLMERRSLDNLATLLSTLGVPARSGGGTFAGPNVTPEKALQVSAVYACVTLIAESVAMLPGDLLRKTNGVRTSAEDHPYQRLLFEEPNPEQDSGEFWRQIVGAMLLRGNGYAAMEGTSRGLVSELWPIPPWCCELARTDTGRLGYVVSLPRKGLDRVGSRTEGKFALAATEVLHFRAYGTGPVGLSPIGLARQAVGLAMATEEHGARFFGQSAEPGGVIKVPKSLSDSAYDRLLANWKELHQGNKQAWQIALLEEGAEWQQTGMTNDDAQFLETRRFQLQEMMRYFGYVPPWLVSDVDRSTSWGTGIEQQGIGFVTYGLLRWITRLERTVKRGLLNSADRTLYPKWNVGALLRADALRRAQAHAIERQWGVLNADEWRGDEDRNPIGGPAGESYLNPLNFAPMMPASVDEDNLRQMIAELLPEMLNGHRV